MEPIQKVNPRLIMISMQIWKLTGKKLNRLLTDYKNRSRLKSMKSVLMCFGFMRDLILDYQVAIVLVLLTRDMYIDKYDTWLTET